MPTLFPNLPPRENWTYEHYQKALAILRKKAKSLRERANQKDHEAEELKKEFAARATHKLPLFNDGNDSIVHPEIR